MEAQVALIAALRSSALLGLVSLILVMLGDFNIHLDKPQAADFHTLLASFDLKRVLTTATHKSGNQLGLIYTQHCSTDHVLVTPLHTSDHFLLTLNLYIVPDTTHTPPHVIFRCNLCSLSPSHLSAMVSSSLPSPEQLASLDVPEKQEGGKNFFTPLCVCIYMHIYIHTYTHTQFM